jgi:hypothetical protein
LKKLGEIAASPVITDSGSASLIKFESSYLQGRRFLAAVKRSYFSENWIATRRLDPSQQQRKFDLKSKEAPSQVNEFQEDEQIEQIVEKEGNITLLVSAGSQTALNRSSFPEDSTHDVVPMPWKDARNFLIFVHSELGNSMATSNRLRTSLFPVFVDGFTHSSVAPVGRYLLFRVINPTQTFRLLLNLSSLDHRLPPAAVVGSTREPLSLVGHGSGRVISAPIRPQLINGVPYICIDMGMDAVPISEVRTGIMRLWRTNLPMDYKRLVGMARNISVITDEEYHHFRAPSDIRKIPSDFLNQEFEYSGVYEDGWVSGDSYFILNGNGKTEPMVIRGVVPITFDGSFTTNLTATVDGKEVGHRQLGIGEFEVRLPISPQSGRRRVEFHFDKTQSLLYNDRRRAAILLRCLGFGASCGQQEQSDVVTDGRGLWRGDNWHTLEKQFGKSFRWVNNDAEILVSPEVNGHEFAVDLEPGPGMGGKPMKLQAIGPDGQILAEKNVDRRQTIQFHLAPSPTIANGFSAVRLHTLNGGLSVPGESRTLNFRVFRVALQAAAPAQTLANDITAAGDVIQLGANWNPLESLDADHFRWVDNDPVITISDPRVLAKGLTMELEPGPGIKTKPMLLRILDAAGRQVQAIEITGRQTVNIFPPPTTKKPAEYRLHVEGGGQKIPSDPRILNFRVFKIHSSAHSASSSRDITEGTSLRVGKGWYPVESFTDGTFRWVNNDAEFTVDSTRTHLAVELQPGPGFDFKQMVLKVLDASGRQVQAAEVNGRQTVKLLLPSVKGKEVTYRLHVDGGGKKIPSDPRTLNFRVFKLKVLD